MNEQRVIHNLEVILEPEEEGGYHVFCPCLKGCHSYGRDKNEALRNIKEAIRLWLDSAQELGVEIAEKEVISVKV